MTSTQAQEKGPLFLLDIDGVVNLFDAWIPTGRVWWDTKGRMRQDRVAPAHLREAVAASYRLLLNPSHPEWIAEIVDAGYDPVWATMWQDRAWLFGEQAGFGVDWDYIDFDSFRPQFGEQRMTGNGVGTYKHPGIVHVFGDRPGVWVDDDMTPFQHEWARKRTEAGIPTLFIQPDPEFGITREHIDQILEFARDLELAGLVA
jgi:hypothetical protein